MDHRADTGRAAQGQGYGYERVHGGEDNQVPQGQGVLKESRAAGATAKHSRKRPYAVRKSREYKAKRPGDIVEIDTMELRPLPGMVRKHFTAMDMVARYSAVGVRGSATARTAKESLERVVERMPFANRGIQVDGGSEFMAEFEEACEDKRIQLFVLPQ